MASIGRTRQRKGADAEREFAAKLREIWPDCKRNAGNQAQKKSAGCDVVDTGCFNFEVKAGKKYTVKFNRDLLEQVKAEGDAENYDVVIVKPHKEKPYVVMPFEDFMDILRLLKSEDVI